MPDTKSTRDLSHLDALTSRLGREKARLAEATTDDERAFRTREITACEKEIAAEYKFLGIEDVAVATDLTDDELFQELSEIEPKNEDT